MPQAGWPGDQMVLAMRRELCGVAWVMLARMWLVGRGRWVLTAPTGCGLRCSDASCGGVARLGLVALMRMLSSGAGGAAAESGRGGSAVEWCRRKSESARCGEQSGSPGWPAYVRWR